MSIPGMPPDQNQGVNLEGVSRLSKEMLEEALETTKDLNRISRVQVSESVFKEFFLPAIMRQEGHMENMHKWCALVNGFLRWVDVVDDKTGLIVFEVPPIVNTGNMDVRAPRDPMMPTISNIIDMAVQSTRNRVMKRQYEIRDKTLDAFKNMFSVMNNSEHTVAWRKIYAYYNIDFPENLVAGATGGAGNDASAKPSDNSANTTETETF